MRFELCIHYPCAGTSSLYHVWQQLRRSCSCSLTPHNSAGPAPLEAASVTDFCQALCGLLLPDFGCLQFWLGFTTSHHKLKVGEGLALAQLQQGVLVLHVVADLQMICRAIYQLKNSAVTLPPRFTNSYEFVCIASLTLYLLCESIIITTTMFVEENLGAIIN